MLLWNKVRHLSQASLGLILNFYSQKQIPIEIRELLATWIENNFLPGDMIDDVADAEYDDDSIQQLCAEFFKEIDRAVQNVADFIVQWKLRNASAALETRFTPLELYKRIRDCLNEELRILKQETSLNSQDPNGSSLTRPKVSEIMNMRNEYRSRIQFAQSIRGDLMVLIEKFEETRLELDNFSQVLNADGIDQQNYKQRLSQRLNDYSNKLQSRASQLYEQEMFCLAVAEGLEKELKTLVYKLNEDFLQPMKWSGLDFDATLSLDNVQQWCTEISEVIKDVYDALQQSLQDSAIPFIHYELDESSKVRLRFLMDTMENLNYILLTNSMTVASQPPQVIKQSKAFGTSVALLCGDKNTPQVKISSAVLNETQAAALYVNKDPRKYINTGCGKIANKVGRKQTDNGSSRSDYQFAKLAISKMSRQEDSRAMREKFCLLFFTEMQIGSKVYAVWCCSVPFVYIVANSQIPEGWGTIFWDNSFKDTNRTPFTVPEHVSWSQMAVALNKCFKTMTKTEWDLSEVNLRCLGEKICQRANFSGDSLISRNSFYERDSISPLGKWGWFYSHIDLTNRHFRLHWHKGFIVGFIDLKEAEKIIAPMEPGTFLVRFSNNREGAVSMSACKRIKEGRPETRIENLMLRNEDLKQLGDLGDRILTSRTYSHVYHQAKDKTPTLTSKVVAFKQPASRKGSGNKYIPVSSPYVRMELIMSAIPDGSDLTIPSYSKDRPSIDSGIQCSSTAEADNSEDEDLMDMAAEIAGLGLDMTPHFDDSDTDDSSMESTDI